MIPTIAIVGRRNVGKSALFNKFIEEEKAIVSEIAGTTRDRTEGICLWRGREIKFVDTGGLDIGNRDLIEKEILEQTEFAANAGDLILFVVDLRDGLMPQESAIAKKLQKYRDKIILVGNKADGPKIRQMAEDPEWRRLSFGQPLPVSAATGAGVGDLLDVIYERLEIPLGPPFTKGEIIYLPFKKGELERDLLKIAIIGQPNVGKSSLLNAILGEKRVIVSPIPHTTREPQDTEIIYQGQKITLVDTAGLRRKAKIKEELIRLGISRTERALKKADIVFFIIEPVFPLSAQDKQISSLIAESKASVVILVNKWDLAKGKTEIKNLTLAIQAELPHLNFAPIIFISAFTGLHVNKLLPLACGIFEQRKKWADKEELAQLLPKLILRHKPVRAKGGTKHPIIRSIEQTGANPPEFVIWIGTKQSLHFSYVRFLENRLREYFGFDGTPIRIWVRQERR